jgi:hypothetical protein
MALMIFNWVSELTGNEYVKVFMIYGLPLVACNYSVIILNVLKSRML